MSESRFEPRALLLVISCTLGIGPSSGAQTCAPAPSVGYWLYDSFSASAGDWDGDGLVDIAVRGFVDHGGIAYDATPLRSLGDGTFAWPNGDDRGAAGNFLRVAVDWDRTGGPDLVAVRDDSVLVSRNIGGGDFQLTAQQAFGGDLVACASADFNQDGWPDIVAADVAGDRVLVALNDGAGGLGVGSWHAVGAQPVDVAVADVDGDLLPDLLVLNQGSEDLSTLLNLGSDFAGEQRRGPMPGARRLEVARVDGDALVDLVVASTPGSVRPWLGDGAGGWIPGEQAAIGGEPTDLLVADFDADGVVEIVTTHADSLDISLLWAAGDGRFEPEQRLGAGAGQVLAADVDGDDLPELVATLSPGGSVLVYDGLDVAGRPGLLFTPVGARSVSIASGDFDGDGRTDLATTHRVEEALSVVSGEGDGAFGPAVRLTAGAGVSSLTAMDVDGINGPDLVAGAAFSRTLWIARNDGVGGFLPTEVLPLATMASTFVGAADVDAASGTDLIIGGSSFGAEAWLNDGSGGFTLGAEIAIGLPVQALGDLDGDGLTDILAFNEAWPELFVSLNEGDGTYSEREGYLVGSRIVEPMRAGVIGDVDLDGDADVVGVTGGDNGRLFLLRNRGDGSLDTREWGPPVSGTLHEAHAILVELDGLAGPELALVGDASDRLWIFRGGVDGAFASPVTFACGSSPTGLSAIDVGGTEPPKLAVSNDLSGGITTLSPCFEPRWLLRNAAVESLSPVTPPLSTIFGARDAGLALELRGPDGTPRPGESDDDDAYLSDFISGDADPDPSVGSGARPLVFYQTTAGTDELRVWRGPDGRVRIRY